MSISKDGQRLLSLEDWERHAGPKRETQWRDQYSAKEAARYWLAAKQPALPADVAALVASHARFGPVTRWTAEPEVRMRFDRFRGEPRNADLVVTATDKAGEYLIAVEAKANESFGETVGDALASALDQKLLNPRSNATTRIERLVAALLGPRRKDEPALARIRYQLLTATAGALFASAKRQDDRVLVLVQEFLTGRTNEESRIRNGRDLDSFVERLSHGQIQHVESGRIHGPIAIADSSILFEEECPDLFVAKISCEV
jgi:hypothetical protein